MSDLSVFQRLYDSEINFSVTTFWDGGFDAKLGDIMNGFYPEEHCESMEEAAEYLQEQAITHFPDSTFTKSLQNTEGADMT